MTKPVLELLHEDIIPSVVQNIRTAGALRANDIGFHKTLDSNLATRSREPDSSELDIKNDTELEGSNWKVITNTLDILFERADVLFDEIENKGSIDNSKTFTYLEESNNVIKDESKVIGKKMEKPQLEFSIPVDNSELNPFKPKLTSKPNALIPFEESVKLVQPENSDGSDIVDPPFYPHPYEYEIDNQPYRNSIISKCDPIPSNPWESTNAIWIDQPEQIDELVNELSNSSEIAVDLEHHDYRTYYGLVCLMQISTRKKDWIIDTLALRDDLQKLNVVFTNPQIVKVFHGAFMDIIWLQRDLGLYIVSLFDTYHASKKLGFPKFSLAYLLETFAKFKTSKKYQLADWRIRPLSTSMLAYARSDTHFLLNIFDHLKNKLIDQGNGKMQSVLHDSRLVAKRRFEYTKFRPLKGTSLVTCPVMSSNPLEPFLPIVVQYNIPYHIKPVVEVLYNWRDNLARQFDESVRYIMSNQALALLATLSRPVDPKKILSIPTFITDFIRKNADELAFLINNILDRLENSDWELSEAMKPHTSTTKYPSDNQINKTTPDSIKLQNEIFDNIWNENNQLLKSSKLFNEVQEHILSVKFSNGLVSITMDEAVKRVSAKNEEFRKIYDFKKPKILEPRIQSMTDIETPTVQPEVEIPKQSVDESAGEHKDDIITLRKPKRTKTRGFKRQSDDGEPVFDYSGADNLMNSNKKSDNARHKKKKFDPYSKTSVGPRGARSGNRVHGGRSTTFKN
ncbi:hypothetical protein CANTEDRAFT_128954 [Yamadazyma tenuis ATCC 10573]|uniref:HRDC domain-containing protein n=1 Tax=Candida tenuis (strain ATCC 10573 / BCRC 21748 / CBS 615 / JCM 9827 / NBRC 10315 / NRRL Y-1498 / VKM Y-70) TaxID=590646 RepID=G3AWL9_CANTC|nr:uncharacterized protein CANTEDRAFT_128954 [Yamadazyma tenuis ATCC 10573]EGV66566.1 hypothetical protein CANTEDRAFT_128954 [Yamadazyma tenuis ATCC 10573]